MSTDDAGGQMLHRRLVPFIAVAALLASVGCADVPAQQFTYQTDVGVVVPDGAGGHCLVIPREAIDSGTALQLVSTSFAGSGEAPSVGRLRVTGDETGGCGEIHAGPSDHRYRVALPDGYSTWGAPHVALFEAGSVTIQDGEPVGDLDGDGTPERFRMCASTEGLHLTIWSGDPLAGTRRWHFYYYLGYDVEPNCIEAEYAPSP